MIESHVYKSVHESELVKATWIIVVKYVWGWKLTSDLSEVKVMLQYSGCYSYNNFFSQWSSVCWVVVPYVTWDTGYTPQPKGRLFAMPRSGVRNKNSKNTLSCTCVRVCLCVVYVRVYVCACARISVSLIVCIYISRTRVHACHMMWIQRFAYTYLHHVIITAITSPLLLSRPPTSDIYCRADKVHLTSPAQRSNLVYINTIISPSVARCIFETVYMS